MMGMFGWDLPPGVSTRDLPGNSDSEVAWERWFEGLKPGDPVVVDWHYGEPWSGSVVSIDEDSVLVHDHAAGKDRPCAPEELNPPAAEDDDVPASEVAAFAAEFREAMKGVPAWRVPIADSEDEDTVVELTEEEPILEAVLDEAKVEYQYLRWDPTTLDYVLDGEATVHPIEDAIAAASSLSGNEGLVGALTTLRDHTEPTIDGKPADLYIGGGAQPLLRLRRV